MQSYTDPLLCVCVCGCVCVCVCQKREILEGMVSFHIIVENVPILVAT
jgi:hypothetical protein